MVLFDYAVTAQILYFPMYYLLQERAGDQVAQASDAAEIGSSPSCGHIRNGMRFRPKSNSNLRDQVNHKVRLEILQFLSCFYSILHSVDLRPFYIQNLDVYSQSTKQQDQDMTTGEVQLDPRPARTLSEAPHQAGNVHWNNAVRNDGRISRPDLASPTSPSAQGWFVDSWSPTFVDKAEQQVPG